MSQAPNVPEEVLRQIAAGAASVRAAGEALTIRIKAYETWLSKLPGRVEASCIISQDDDGEGCTCLSLDKEGKEWSLSLRRYADAMERLVDRKFLRDASIHEKAWAIEFFPKLLTSIITAQQRMVNHATSSVSSFDAFAKSIGMKEGE